MLVRLKPTLLGALLSLAFGSACLTPGGLLAEVRVSNPVVAPDADGLDDTARLHYRLNRPASISLVLEQPGGGAIPLRTDEPRPAAGEYEFGFDGTYATSGEWLERRVLGDGAYRLVLEARDESGLVETAAATVEVRGADTSPPRIENLTVEPGVLSPNFDAVDDLAHVSYRLSERARVSYRVVDADGETIWIGPTDEREPGEYAAEWNALVNGQPVSDGTYRFVVAAEDRAGNVVAGAVPIEVVAAGRAAARILSVEIGPQQMMLGDLLTINIRVRNEGDVPLRTHGPDPGYTYSSYDNYFSIDDGARVDRAGMWRVGVDWAGSPGAAGGKYPYRWGLGEDLAPGEETTVVGHIRIDHEDQRARFGDNPEYHRMYFFAALIQEGVAVHQDRIGGTEIRVSF